MKKIFLILFVLSLQNYAQNLDSLFNQLLELKTPNVKTSLTPAGIEEESAGKCAFGLLSIIKNNYEKFSLDKQQQITKILERPELTSSIVSPKNLFRIHYDESGINKPGYSVEDLAVAFDSAYNYEVNILGYPAPPSDGNLGGDDLYDVYIITTIYYGYTVPEIDLGSGKYKTYIVIDNDFGSGFKTHGIEAAQVTAAHEFHHAIQYGSYGLINNEDVYYYEITSTSMEEFVYDSVDDYYNYMSSYFNDPTRRFTRSKAMSNDGYDLAVWNIFLREKFDDNIPNTGDLIIKKSWELIGEKKYRAITAIAHAMNEYDFSFPQAFNEFGVWLYFTKTRAKDSKYFEEAEYYPLVEETYTINFDTDQKSLMVSSEPTSINYVVFLDNSQGLPDTLVANLTNSDIESTFSDDSEINFNITLAVNSFSGAIPIADYYYTKVDGENSSYISDSYILNNELASDFENRSTVDFVFPQPFVYQDNTMLFIPTYTDVSGKADLYIYSTDMNLVYHNEEAISNSGKIVVRYSGLDENGHKLASGVYIYVTRANGKIKKGKFVVIN